MAALAGGIYSAYQCYKLYGLSRARGYVYDVGVPNANGKRTVKWRYAYFTFFWAFKFKDNRQISKCVTKLKTLGFKDASLIPQTVC